jgi:two-component system response regulator HydG
VDDAGSLEGLRAGLAAHGVSATAASTTDEALALLATEDFDAVVANLDLQGLDGPLLCERCALNHPDAVLIALSACFSVDDAVSAFRSGAHDLLTLPVETGDLVLALERGAKHRALREEVRRLRKVLAESRRFSEIVGESAPIKGVFDLIDRVADTDSTVLVTGETGTGKELIARALHDRSRRKLGPFVAVNCAAVPEPLLESELFGHERGAFTDAKAARPGLLVQANGGTLFLDEIAETSMSMQAKLLRALQERRVRPVGGDSEHGFDARIVAASNRALEDAVADGRFRQDLFYRLNVIHVRVPPLRVRGSDVLLIAQHFLEHYAARAGKNVVGLSSGVAKKLLAYSWPGNVRELQNCIERAVALTQFENLAVDDLPEKIQSYSRSHVIVAGDNTDELVPMEAVERRYILRVLEAAGGNKTLAAQILGLDRKTLSRKLDRYESGRSGSGVWQAPKTTS